LLRQNLVASTRNGEDAPLIAPGAENVGQAQILTELSKPFELEGLFGAADAGAFAGRNNDDVPMLADEDGDIFWDAVEDPMDEDGYVIVLRMGGRMLITLNSIPMESDDLKHIIPRKRSLVLVVGVGEVAVGKDRK